MPRNASGVYTLPESAFVAGTVIQSAPVNSDFSDIATALTQSLASTGVTSMTGPIKAASGSVTAPSYTFSSATGTGFYLSGTDEMSWTAAGVLAATFAATGAVTWVGAQTLQSTIAVSGAATFSSTIASGAQTIVTGTEPAQTIRNSDNDASEHELIRYALGSGAGDTASRRIIGAGANDVTEIRDYIASTEILRQTASLVSPKKNISLDAGITVIATAGYVDQAEISTPSNPAANRSKYYSKDDGTGVTRLFHLDSAGSENVLLMPATQAQQETATSNLVGVTSGRQHFHPGHPKAGGNFDGSGTPAFRSGDYGMGAITDNGTGDYTLAIDTAFANTNYWINGWSRSGAGTRAGIITAVESGTKTESSLQVSLQIADDSTAPVDSTESGITFWGDYA